MLRDLLWEIKALLVVGGLFVITMAIVYRVFQGPLAEQLACLPKFGP